MRAWTIHRGDTAPKAAGVIHTDFERGFIRAETVGYDDFVATGGWKGAKEKGVVRSEGKEYVVHGWRRDAVPVQRLNRALFPELNPHLALRLRRAARCPRR